MITTKFCRAKMSECEQLALLAEEREFREAFRDLAQKWRMLAASAEAQGRVPALDLF